MASAREPAEVLALFSDPATPFKVEGKKGRILVHLVRYGQERQYFVDDETGQINARHNGRRHASLKALLASEEFADMRGFASTQRRVLTARKLDQLIDPAGVIDPAGEAQKLTLNKGRELLVPNEGNALKIVLIDGPAGVGKTSFIERMVFERAGDATLPPILHITSKGRRLSNLPDAIGKTIGDLQADFRSDQVAVLAGLSALQIAIDGFDELVQPDGYGNAWAALEELIRQIESGGPLILAGRDTFFDQQDVRRRLDRFGTKVDLQMIRLHEVGEQAARGWLQRNGWKAEAVESQVLKEFLRRPYTRRPFFLAQIAPHKSMENLPAERGSPQAILIDELVAREAKLIKAGIPDVSESAIESALNALFEEMASDMANREVDTIPREYLEFYCDVAFDGVVSGEQLSAIRHKVGSVAFIETNEARGELRFPHSEIQNHFFATAIFDALATKRPYPPLRSAVLGADLVEAFADVARIAPQAAYASALDRLLEILAAEGYAIRQASNVTALIIAALVRGEAETTIVDIKGAATQEARVFDTLSRAKLVDVSIGRLDARGADLTNVTFEKSLIGILTADETTRFGTTVPAIGALQIEQNQSMGSIHSTEEITAWLKQHSSAFKESDAKDWRRGRDLKLVRFFDRVCRRFMRQHYIRDTESDDGSFLLHDPLWPEVSGILEKEKRLVVTKSFKDARPTAGKSPKFYHVVRPETLLVPADKASLRVRLAVIERAEEMAAD